MFDIHKLFATNATKEIHGVEHEIAPSVFVTVARFNNKKFQSRLTELYADNKFLIESKTEEGDEKSQEIHTQAMAEKILVGWKGDIGIKGEVLPYSVENAVKLLSIPDFKDKIFALSNQTANYRLEADKETAKN